MYNYKFTKMNDFTDQHIQPIRELEQHCKTLDQSSLRVGIDSLKEKDGDEAYLCHLNDELICFLSWYSSDGAEANVNAMVHPEHRRQGVYRTLLRQAMMEMHSYHIQTCRFRIPADSQAGLDCIRAMGSTLSSSEFTMMMNQLSTDKDEGSRHITFRIANECDTEFMVRCLADAFGDTEIWTRNYLSRTSEATRVTYIAMKGISLIGMIRDCSRVSILCDPHS
ncbi:GNAT family N-acetyltransferase [Paenibacillus massiliensis]|uniref:GNAT family N-acetyltransferase n=1 Tax=Paenibacillus massiliensis TaxID=225917 RepID=UPI000470BC39|nr:GNAT family N-acetyltransferase [Paenibacillus massiliensis]